MSENFSLDSSDSNSINTPSVYDTTGRRVQKWKKGLNIIRKKDGTTRKVVVK